MMLFLLKFCSLLRFLLRSFRWTTPIIVGIRFGPVRCLNFAVSNFRNSTIIFFQLVLIVTVVLGFFISSFRTTTSFVTTTTTFLFLLLLSLLFLFTIVVFANLSFNFHLFFHQETMF